MACRGWSSPSSMAARIATIVRSIRAANQGRTLFCDCGDTLHGTHPAQKTPGEFLIPILNSLGLDATTAHWEFAYGPETLKQHTAKLSYPDSAKRLRGKKLNGHRPALILRVT